MKEDEIAEINPETSLPADSQPPVTERKITGIKGQKRKASLAPVIKGT